MDQLSAFAVKEKGKEEAAELVRKITSEQTSAEEVVNMYKHWAETYDQDMQTLGRILHKAGAEALERVVSNKEARILDIGAGTGLSGQALAELGYHNIDGLDAVQEMLDQAKLNKVYNEYICAEIGKEKTQIPDNAYDAALCVGSVYHGHITDECFPEFTRIVKPGGYIVITETQSLSEQSMHKGILKIAEKGLWTWKRDISKPYNDHKTGNGVIYTMTVI